LSHQGIEVNTQLALNLPSRLAARQSLFMSADGRPITTSQAVAERFSKSHKNVLQAIQNLLVLIPDPRFAELNFQLSIYQIQGGKSSRRAAPEYRLSRDGFALLTMRFTGREALAWQIAFIEAFNDMEAELQAEQARCTAALDQLRPNLRPVVNGTKAGLSRQAIGFEISKTCASVTYHRGQAKRLGLLESATPNLGSTLDAGASA
jgi:Rha family phage regulatory protein